jgi:hypothetical protein
LEWKGVVDSLKVGFLSSEGIKKEGRVPPPRLFVHHVHSCCICRKLFDSVTLMMCGVSKNKYIVVIIGCVMLCVVLW